MSVMARTPRNENTRCLREPLGPRHSPFRTAVGEW